MKLSENPNIYISCLGIMAMALLINSCEAKKPDQQDPGVLDQRLDFPEFITPVEKYFETRIGEIPVINENSYQLKISGAVNKPTAFSLEDLRKLEMVDKIVTIECIGNSANGNLLGTATWKGFRIWDLLASLGINDEKSIVKYICADGYFTFNSLEELKNGEVLGALYMNGAPLLPTYGFPLRVIFPGYYGVRQPGWIVEINLLETGDEDYWSQNGRNTDSPMEIDSKIFFPSNNSRFTLGNSIRIGGAAYGSKRISSVDVTVNDGKTWLPANIQQSLNEDYVWIFWEVNYTPKLAETITIRSRATATDRMIQPQVDMESFNGTNSWPTVTISIIPGN